MISEKEERLSKYIEVIKIEAAEAVQKYEELKLMFAELFEDSMWMYSWVYNNAFFKLRATPKFNQINKKWEFEK